MRGYFQSTHNGFLNRRSQVRFLPRAPGRCTFLDLAVFTSECLVNVGRKKVLISNTTPETLRRWVIQARIDRGLVVGPTTDELAEIKALRKEVADQQRTIEILKAATTFFARENDPLRR